MFLNCFLLCALTSLGAFPVLHFSLLDLLEVTYQLRFIRNKSMFLIRLSKLVHPLHAFWILRCTADKERYYLLPVPCLPILFMGTVSTILRQYAPYSFRHLGLIHGWVLHLAKKDSARKEFWAADLLLSQVLRPDGCPCTQLLCDCTAESH